MRSGQSYGTTIYRLRRRFERETYTRAGKQREAVLGDELGRLHVPGRPGYLYVRELSQRDSGGNNTLGPASVVQGGVNSNYLPRAGQRVYIGYGLNGQLQVLGGSFEGMIAQGINPVIVNANAPERQFVNMQNATILLSQPVNTQDTPGAFVTVYPLLYDQDFTLNHYAGTESAASKINLTSYIPSIIGAHRIVILYFRTYEKTIQVTASTSKAVSEAFTFADVMECDAQRDADTVPIRGYQLDNETTTITTRNLYQDYRQWLNIPQPQGFPSVITRKRLIRPHYRVLTYGTITDVTMITVLGSLTIL